MSLLKVMYFLNLDGILGGILFKKKTTFEQSSSDIQCPLHLDAQNLHEWINCYISWEIFVVTCYLYTS